MAAVNLGLEITSGVADGGVAHFLDTDVEYTNGTLLSVRQNGVEKFNVNWQGDVTGRQAAFSTGGIFQGQSGAPGRSTEASPYQGADGLTALGS